MGSFESRSLTLKLMTYVIVGLGVGRSRVSRSRVFRSLVSRGGVGRSGVGRGGVGRCRVGRGGVGWVLGGRSHHEQGGKDDKLIKEKDVLVIFFPSDELT